MIRALATLFRARRAPRKMLADPEMTIKEDAEVFASTGR
jgi:hypothetical protein